MVAPPSGHQPAGERSSRRSVVVTGLAAGLFGGAWFTGLSVLARGRHPQILAIGDDDWQVVLVEHRSRRALILAGNTPVADPADIAALLGAWRPGVDIVAGNQESLAGLDEQTSDQLAPSLTIVLNTGDTPQSGLRRAIGDGLHLRLGSISIEFTPTGSTADMNGSGWIAHLRVNDLVVAIAPSLDVIANHGDISSALALAPAGDVAVASSRMPQAAIATNQSNLRDIDFGTESASAETTLVRIFPGDTARMEFRDGVLRLPAWTSMVQIP